MTACKPLYDSMPGKAESPVALDGFGPLWGFSEGPKRSKRKP
ncbi:Uncharacterised protein [uncultured Blautia sp.]|nr:hypothetical protein HMPREF1546_02542 [Oscillibacter sp. KLE 1745]SCI68879.1 Uncharacterised protein [uncultured Blautia sp.]